MVDIFKVRLKAKSTAAGANLSQKRIDALADRLHKKFPELTDEAEHDTHIEDLYDADTLKELGALDDHNRTKAAREAKQEKPKEEKQDTANDEPAWFKTYREQTDAKLAAFEKEKVQGTIKQQLASKLKDVPAKFYENWQLPDAEDKIAEFAENVTKSYTDFRTELGITPGASMIPPTGLQQQNRSTKVSPEIIEFAKKQEAKQVKTN